jgi:hypothetical protein
MKPAETDAVERRLRLLVAREFAARGYYLDAEGMYVQSKAEQMGTEELELLAKVAALRGDWRIAERRYASLAECSSVPGKRLCAEKHAAFARERSTLAPVTEERVLHAIRYRWVPFLVAAVIGAVTTLLVLRASGMLSIPK